MQDVFDGGKYLTQDMFALRVLDQTGQDVVSPSVAPDQHGVCVPGLPGAGFTVQMCLWNPMRESGNKFVIDARGRQDV